MEREDRLLPGVGYSLTKCMVTEKLVCTLNTDETKEVRLFPTSETLQELVNYPRYCPVTGADLAH